MAWAKVFGKQWFSLWGLIVRQLGVAVAHCVSWVWEGSVKWRIVLTSSFGIMDKPEGNLHLVRKGGFLHAVSVPLDSMITRHIIPIICTDFYRNTVNGPWVTMAWESHSPQPNWDWMSMILSVIWPIIIKVLILGGGEMNESICLDERAAWTEGKSYS